MKKYFNVLILSILLLCSLFSCKDPVNSSDENKNTDDNSTSTSNSYFSEQVVITGEVADDSNCYKTSNFSIVLKNDEFDFNVLKCFMDVTSWFSGTPSDVKFRISSLSDTSFATISIQLDSEKYGMQFFSKYSGDGDSNSNQSISCTIPGKYLKSGSSVSIEDTKGSFCDIKIGDSKIDNDLEAIKRSGFDDECEITKFYQIGEVTFPATINIENVGKSLTSFDRGCFNNPKYITRINLNSLIKMPLGANDCPNLKEIYSTLTVDETINWWQGNRIPNGIMVYCSDGTVLSDNIPTS